MIKKLTKKYMSKKKFRNNLKISSHTASRVADPIEWEQKTRRCFLSSGRFHLQKVPIFFLLFLLGIFVPKNFISYPFLPTLPPSEGANLASFILLSILENIIVSIIVIIKIVKISACPWAADCGTALRLTSTGTFSFNSQSLPTFR